MRRDFPPHACGVRGGVQATGVVFLYCVSRVLGK